MGMIQSLQFQPTQADWESWMTTLQVWAGNLDNITQQLPLTGNQIGGYVYPKTNAENKLGLTGLNLTYPSGDPRRYNAVGNGSADDYVPLQTAINVAGYDNLVTVSWPGLSFATSKPLTMLSGVTIVGVGYNSVLMWQAGVNLPTSCLLNFSGVQNAYARHIRINGNRLQATALYGCYFHQAGSCGIDSCYVHSCHDDNVHCNDSQVITIANNFVYDSLDDGIEVEKSTIVIVSGNQVLNNQGRGIYVFPGVTNNIGDTNFGCHNVTISSNTSAKNGGNGIEVEGSTAQILLPPSLPATSSSIAIGDNTVFANGACGIALYNGVKASNVSDNTISYNGSWGILLYGSIGNTVDGNTTHNDSQLGVGSYAEIYLEGGSANNIISKNTLLMDTLALNGGNGTTGFPSYAIQEATSADGPNIVRGNSLPNGIGSNGGILLLNAESIKLSRGNVGISNIGGQLDENGGTATFNGGGSSFQIPHNIAGTPGTYNVTPGSANAAQANFYVTVDATNITVTFVTATPPGTNNISLRWYAAL